MKNPDLSLFKALLGHGNNQMARDALDLLVPDLPLSYDPNYIQSPIGSLGAGENDGPSDSVPNYTDREEMTMQALRNRFSRLRRKK